jgi:hypothetical protein
MNPHDLLQLLSIVGSAIGTVVFVSYRLGKLEATIVVELREHDRRITALERARVSMHGGV